MLEKFLGKAKWRAERFGGNVAKLGLLPAISFELNWILNKERIFVNVPNCPQPLVMRRHSTDPAVFTQIFIHEELRIETPEAPKVIIDGGAYVGYSAVFFARQFPNAKIIAIEADYANFQLLQRNCSVFKNVDCLYGALWNKKAYLHIRNPEDPPWAYQIEECAESVQTSIPSLSIKELINDYNLQTINILKLDIEGAEKFIFHTGAFEDWLPSVRAALIEVHGNDAEQAVINAFNQFKFNSSKLGEKLYFINPSVPT